MSEESKNIVKNGQQAREMAYIWSEDIAVYMENLKSLIDYRRRSEARNISATEADAAINFTMQRIKFLSDMKLNSLRTFFWRSAAASMFRLSVGFIFGILATLLTQRFMLP